MRDFGLEFRPREILLDAGFPAHALDADLSMLCASTDIPDLGKRYRAAKYGMDPDQFMFPLVQPLFRNNATFRDHILGQVGERFLNRQELIHFFTELGQQPLGVAGSEFSGRFDGEEGDRFPETYRQVIFDTLKEVFCN